MVLATTPSVASHIAAGKLRGLAVLGKERSAQLPDVPTLAEIGGPSVNYEVWYALMAPAGTPTSAQAALRKASAAAIDAELTQRLAKLGYQTRTDGPEQLTALLQQDLSRWRELASRAKISIE